MDSPELKQLRAAWERLQAAMREEQRKLQPIVGDMYLEDDRGEERFRLPGVTPEEALEFLKRKGRDPLYCDFQAYFEVVQTHFLAEDGKHWEGL